MAAELLTGLSIFKGLYDSAKALKDINDTAVRNTAIVELTEKILAAREAQTTLAERIRELEAQVAGFETWDREKQRYELHEIPPGIWVRALKQGMEQGEKAHYICEKCYQNRQKSVLHRSETFNGLTHYKCEGCGADYKAGHFTRPEVRTHR